MPLTDIHGKPIKDLASAQVVSADRAAYMRETKHLNTNRLNRLGLKLSAPHACDCCRLPDHEYQQEDYQ